MDKTYNTQFAARTIVIICIFSLALFIASWVSSMGFIVHMIFRNDDADIPEEERRKFSKSYWRYVLLILVWVVVFVVVYLAIYYMYYQSVLGYFYAAYPGESTAKLQDRWDSFSRSFSYKSVRYNIDYFFRIKNFLVTGVVVLWLVYVLFAKTFVKFLEFPRFMKDPEIDDINTQRKFLYLFSLNIIAVLVFSCLAFLICQTYFSSVIEYIIIFLAYMIYIVLYCTFIGFALRRSRLWLMIVFGILLVWTVFISYFLR